MTDQEADRSGNPTTTRSADSPPVSELSFSEQLSEQLGGMRGITESSIPVVMFIVVNIIWSLSPALIVAVGTAFVIVVYRLLRREAIRHAVNGLVGVGVGALLAWRTGEARDFYLPAIITSFVYAAVLIGSVIARRPVIGYVWAVIAAGGRHHWRNHPRLVRVFGWLTLMWAGVFLSRGLVQGGLYLVERENWLGAARLAMGLPLYLVALGVTVWGVRRAAGATLEAEAAAQSR